MSTVLANNFHQINKCIKVSHQRDYLLYKQKLNMYLWFMAIFDVFSIVKIE